MRPEMTGIVVPGKLYGVMAAGRPAVFVGPRHCESADTIRAAGCGITVDRGDVDGLVAALTQLAGDPSLSRRMGERGRSAFLTGYERKLGCQRWADLLADLARGGAERGRTPHRLHQPVATGRTGPGTTIAALSVAPILY
jgi:glycosyltransferase involved in cell wall biosynthesis